MAVTGAPVNVRANTFSATIFVAREGISSETRGGGPPQKATAARDEDSLTSIRVQIKNDHFPARGAWDVVPARVADTRAFDVTWGADDDIVVLRQSIRVAGTMRETYSLMTPTKFSKRKFSICVSFTLDAFGRGPV